MLDGCKFVISKSKYMETIKIQVRDNRGNIIDSYNDVETIEEAIGIKARWMKQYDSNWYMISIHFINK